MTPYDLIQGETTPHTTGTRTRSVGLLAWFLEAVWRLEPEEVPDLICDGGGDRGIDAIFVDEDIREISVFQSKHRDSAGATQGDADLRSFIGVAPYFETFGGFDQLMASHMSPTLRHLLERLDIRTRLEESDYSVRLVFLTNAPLDQAGLDYAAATAGRTPSLEIWDRDRLAAVAARTRRAEMRAERIELSVPDRPTNLELGGEVSIAVGLVPAQELAQLPGIDDLTLFARNVRLGLGRSRVNRELDATLRDAAEHPYFPAYHNGLTLLTRALEVGDRSLSLDGVTVVNGCQSLIALRARQGELTPSMYVSWRRLLSYRNTATWPIASHTAPTTRTQSTFAISDRQTRFNARYRPTPRSVSGKHSAIKSGKARPSPPRWLWTTRRPLSS